jgi:hypothetical protein
MKRKIIIALCIIGFLVVIFYPYTETEPYLKLIQNKTTSGYSADRPEIELLKRSNTYLFSIRFLLNTNSPIYHFKHSSGLIRIGDQDIILNIDKDAPEIVTKIESDSSIFSSISRYKFNFNFYINNEETEKIIKEYNLNNKKIKLYLKYSYKIDNDTIINEINKEFAIDVIENTHIINPLFMFLALIWWFLNGAPHV